MIPLEKVMVRGTALTPLEPFVRGRLGDEAWETLLASMPTEHAEILRSKPLAMSWYPFAMAWEFLPQLLRLADGDESILRELAHAGLEYSIRHIFKAIFKIGSPGFMVARSDMIWRRYYSTGSMTATVEGNAARVAVHDFPHLPPLYDKVILHSVEATIIKAGGEITRARRVPSSTDASASCAFEYEWR
ncbi:MAG: hypothetical protein GXP55_09535 [Deltaproteobacteria bacterium]|nr:hypothetical protein [Deltaproteobacteria bacterium]